MLNTENQSDPLSDVSPFLTTDSNVGISPLKKTTILNLNVVLKWPVSIFVRMERRIKLKTINPHIICKICRGYLIDATTVTECLHTFCKSCLVKHLEDNNTCPSCEIVIHQSHPLQYISFDRTMQDIVYKLVPNLQEHEYRRERDFYKSRGLPYPKQTPGKEKFGMSFDDKCSEKNLTASSSKDENSDYHKTDEQVNICLECYASSLKHLKRKFIRCSAQATITHLKKFIAKKLYHNLEKYKDVDILCNEEILGKDHTLKFVCLTRWRFKEPPLLLQYRPRVEL